MAPEPAPTAAPIAVDFCWFCEAHAPAKTTKTAAKTNNLVLIFFSNSNLPFITWTLYHYQKFPFFYCFLSFVTMAQLL